MLYAGPDGPGRRSLYPPRATMRELSAKRPVRGQARESHCAVTGTKTEKAIAGKSHRDVDPAARRGSVAGKAARAGDLGRFVEFSGDTGFGTRVGRVANTLWRASHFGRNPGRCASRLHTLCADHHSGAAARIAIGIACTVSRANLVDAFRRDQERCTGTGAQTFAPAGARHVITLFAADAYADALGVRRRREVPAGSVFLLPAREALRTGGN